MGLKWVFVLGSKRQLNFSLTLRLQTVPPVMFYGVILGFAIMTGVIESHLFLSPSKPPVVFWCVAPVTFSRSLLVRWMGLVWTPPDSP